MHALHLLLFEALRRFEFEKAAVGFHIPQPPPSLAHCHSVRSNLGPV
eukprot:SAG31_NODE_5943_length_2247_cov_1.319367_4_plen_46_part_01